MSGPRVALLGDVHGNLPALEAVLAHARENGAEAFWNTGDSVGYGPFPEESVATLRALGAVHVAGNIDRKVLKFPSKDEKWRIKKRPEKYRALAWAWRHLSDEAKEWLDALPDLLRLEVAGRRIALTHGTPDSIKEPLFADTPVERLREVAEEAAAEVVLCGHSHDAFHRELATAWIVTPGSVGRQDDGDPRARYALVDFVPDGLVVRHHRLEYDVEAVCAALRRGRLPEAVAEMFRLGRSLKWVLENAPVGASRA
ncbi:MAG: metallophosphoesterase family protein [Thermoanaerobaculia bacterium]